jgi:putrescine transport system permease protein
MRPAPGRLLAATTTGRSGDKGGDHAAMRCYSEVRLGVKPQINAICTIMIAAVALGAVATVLIAQSERAGAGARDKWTRRA